MILLEEMVVEEIARIVENEARNKIGVYIIAFIKNKIIRNDTFTNVNKIVAGQLPPPEGGGLKSDLQE